MLSMFWLPIFSCLRIAPMLNRLTWRVRWWRGADSGCELVSAFNIEAAVATAQKLPPDAEKLLVELVRPSTWNAIDPCLVKAAMTAV